MKHKIPTLKQLQQQDFSQFLHEDYQQKILNKPWYNRLKRVMDLIMAIIVGLILLPLMILLAIAIRLTSKGKAIFTHARIGKDGKPFRLYKFRTMKHTTDAHEFSPTSLKDERITTIGKFLRRTSLDELPQLYNVIRGEMSLVGPRPEMEFIVKTYTDLQRARLLVKPGITGMWQLAGRKDLPLHENVEFDLYYIEHRGLMFDLYIILKTFGVVWKGKGAY